MSCQPEGSYYPSEQFVSVFILSVSPAYSSSVDALCLPSTIFSLHVFLKAVIHNIDYLFIS